MTTICKIFILYNNKSPFAGSRPASTALKIVTMLIKGLRSGNILKGPEIHHYRMGIHSDGTHVINAYGIHMMEQGHGLGNYGPYPFDHEILLKLAKSVESFHNGVLLYKFGVFTVWSQNGEFWLELNNSVLKHIKYIHQMQNLYFDLTGEELPYLLVKD